MSVCVWQWNVRKGHPHKRLPDVQFWTGLYGFGATCAVENFCLNRTQIYRYIHMYTDPDSIFGSCTELGNRSIVSGFFRHADLASLPTQRDRWIRHNVDKCRRGGKEGFIVRGRTRHGNMPKFNIVCSLAHAHHGRTCTREQFWLYALPAVTSSSYMCQRELNPGLLGASPSS